MCVAYVYNMYTCVTLRGRLLQAIHADDNDSTQLSLIYAARNEADIILRDLLEDVAQHDKRFKLCLCLSHPPEGWERATGHIDEDLIR